MNAVPYLVGTPPEWADGVMKFTIKRADPKYELVGPCPRCDDMLSKDVSLLVSAPGYGGSAEKKVLIRVKCNCIQFHEGQPGKGTGCGAEGTVEVPR